MKRLVVAVAACAGLLAAANPGGATTRAGSPCAALGFSAAQAKAMRQAGRRMFPPAVWSAMEASNYYVCTTSRDAKFAATAYRLPVAHKGQTMDFRVLVKPTAPSKAVSVASQIRKDPRGFVRSVNGGSARVTSVAAVQGFVVVGLTMVRQV